MTRRDLADLNPVEWSRRRVGVKKEPRTKQSPCINNPTSCKKKFKKSGGEAKSAGKICKKGIVEREEKFVKVLLSKGELCGLRSR
jgi:hypothetical protein